MVVLLLLPAVAAAPQPAAVDAAARRSHALQPDNKKKTNKIPFLPWAISGPSFPLLLPLRRPARLFPLSGRPPFSLPRLAREVYSASLHRPPLSPLADRWDPRPRLSGPSPTSSRRLQLPWPPLLHRFRATPPTISTPRSRTHRGAASLSSSSLLPHSLRGNRSRTAATSPTSPPSLRPENPPLSAVIPLPRAHKKAPRALLSHFPLSPELAAPSLALPTRVRAPPFAGALQPATNAALPVAAPSRHHHQLRRSQPHTGLHLVSPIPHRNSHSTATPSHLRLSHFLPFLAGELNLARQRRGPLRLRRVSPHAIHRSSSFNHHRKTTPTVNPRPPSFCRLRPPTAAIPVHRKVRHCLYHVRRGPPHLGRYPSPPESHGSPFFPVQGPGGPRPSLVDRRPPLERRHRPHLRERRRYLASVRCRATCV
ncbi:uncharacterized protein LOC127782114 [Oryza glaberrima]|uniref:uncharacterized protein LOC127782114 n=1 Tax=Oryza glaberrima TaxID=4538 RepID=UPI00224C3BC2|nr:uncharacterized protein LOC127782114 [Oryza glaberrima]